MDEHRDLLWEAIRTEVELTLDSTDYTATPREIDEITDRVISDDGIWQRFNEDVLDIIERVLG